MSCEECEEEFKRLYDQLQYEYRDGEDGAGSYGVDGEGNVISSYRPSTQYRRLVGPWQRVPKPPV